MSVRDACTAPPDGLAQEPPRAGGILATTPLGVTLGQSRCYFRMTTSSPSRRLTHRNPGKVSLGVKT
jgi:hypothetical protein